MAREMIDPEREVLAISTVLLCILLNGYITGFSAVAVPDIKKDMNTTCSRSNYSYTDLPTINATNEELSWFGIKTKGRCLIDVNIRIFQPAVTILARLSGASSEDIVEEGSGRGGQFWPHIFPVPWAGSSSPSLQTWPPSCWAGFSVG